MQQLESEPSWSCKLRQIFKSHRRNRQLHRPACLAWALESVRSPSTSTTSNSTWATATQTPGRTPWCRTNSKEAATICATKQLRHDWWADQTNPVVGQLKLLVNRQHDWQRVRKMRSNFQKIRTFVQRFLYHVVLKQNTIYKHFSQQSKILIERVILLALCPDPW